MKITRGIQQKPLKVVVYGPEGIGKSTFASMFPDPLFIDTEGSTARMDVARTETPTSLAMLMQILTEVRDQPPGCKTLVIDTIDWAERLCTAAVLDDFGRTTGYYPILPSRTEIINVNGEPFLRYSFTGGQTAAIELTRCGMAGISPEQLAGELTKYLEEYGKLAQHEVQGILESVGDEAKSRVTSLSPKGKQRGSGKYKRGWKVKIEEYGNSTSVTVHNRHYQLTHLLEFGHRTRLKHGKYGKKAAVGAQPHIEEVNKWAQRELERRIRKALGG